MPRTNGLTAAASALRYWERRQEVASNNLANVTTTGFKGERVFGQMFGDAMTAAQTSTDLRAGTLHETHNPLDVALTGDGFLVVDTPNGERFTRGGSLQLDAERRLVDAGGRPVLGEPGPDGQGGGPIVIPQGAVAIDRAGEITVDGKPVARLRVERGGPGAALAHEGGTLFVPDANRRPVAAAERDVRQGAVEESNVSPVGALVDMIAVQRAYASVQKAVTTLDSVRGTAVTDLGRPV
jgi:flagellar basal-body rod protein FlgF